MTDYERIIADARRIVARGGAVDAAAFERRIRAVGGAGEADALRRLAGVVAVHRARTRFTEAPAERKPAAAPTRALRTRPTISGTMDVRRAGEHVLEWTPLRTVETWELRISVRPDPRRDYEVRDERTMPAETSRLELELGDAAVRVHLLGRGRGGKLVQRAVISGLTAAGWSTRWERRASAS